MHLKVGCLDFVTYFFSQLDRFSKKLINFFDLLSDIPFLSKVFERIDNELFADHDDKKISCKSCKALAIEGSDQVTDVRVYELEHVYLVDNWVFKVGLVAMVFTEDKFYCVLVIHFSEEDN